MFADAYGIVRLAWTMWRKLRENSHKDHWRTWEPDLTGDEFFYGRLDGEVTELSAAFGEARSWERRSAGKYPHLWRNVQRECADVANFAMMIHERARKRTL